MQDTSSVLTALQEKFGSSIVKVSTTQGIPCLHVETDQLPAIASVLHHQKEFSGTLSLMWVVDHHPQEERYEVWYLFTLRENKDWLILTTDLLGDNRLFKSITPKVHAANWYEREIRDMFGLSPQVHPELSRLVRKADWAEGTHPLKKNFPWNRVVERQPPTGKTEALFVEGEGVFEVAVGPIHAGIIEPGHFRFTVAGEPIMHLDLQHFWKHRGVEKLFEQQTLMEAVPLAERVSGDTTMGHSLAYCQAVETLLGISVPRRAKYLRSLFLELERLHNHLGDVGAMCNDTSFALPHAHCGRLKERLMQCNDRLTGSRFLRGVNCVGGIRLDCSTDQLNNLAAELDALEPDFAEVEAILTHNASLADRLETTGVVKLRTAWDHGAVGVVARASGMDRDLRRDRPFAAYDEISIKVAKASRGDVRGRMQIREHEIHESIRVIREIQRSLPEGRSEERRVGKECRSRWSPYH